jgi:hypothetical protein
LTAIHKEAILPTLGEKMGQSLTFCLEEKVADLVDRGSPRGKDLSLPKPPGN